ncbi:MAG: response regulator [Chloroflexia bacterium]|nr:response regulator [Chloroflexia bacterium]
MEFPGKIWNQYKQLLQKQFIDSLDNNIRDIDYWRTRLFMQFILYTFPVGIIVYIPSMIMSVVADLPVVAIVDTFVIILITVLALSRRIKVQTKKYLLIGCLYLLSVILLVFLGSMGPGLIYLIALSILVVLVINKRVAYISVFLNFLLYCLLALNLFFSESGIKFFESYSFGAWIAVGANFLLINLVTVASIALLLEGLQKTILNEKMLFDKLKEEGVKLNEAKEKAIQSDKFKSAFLANMSHEIRTPLNAIVGFANLLARKNYDENQKQYIEVINTSSSQLLNLITDIIDLSKIEAGAVSIQLEKIQFKVFAYSIITSMKQLCPKYLEFRHILNEQDLKEELGIDVHKVSQVISNLVTNSFKYTKKGFIELKMMLTADKKSLIFSVTDSGIGISKENREKVFQRFYQEDAMHSGVGLGLSICASLVKAMDGKISMESEIEKGSTFTVELPNNIEKVTKRTLPSQETDSTDSQTLTGKKILIAEDDEQSFAVLREILEEEQYIITWTNNGSDAVMQAKNNKFDIVLMDIRMPQTDGYEATRQIRCFDTVTPIVAVTAFAFNSDAERAYKAGFNDYLTKPVDFEKLKSLLKKHIN